MSPYWTTPVWGNACPIPTADMCEWLWLVVFYVFLTILNFFLLQSSPFKLLFIMGFTMAPMKTTGRNTLTIKSVAGALSSSVVPIFSSYKKQIRVFPKMMSSCYRSPLISFTPLVSSLCWETREHPGERDLCRLDVYKKRGHRWHGCHKHPVNPQQRWGGYYGMWPSVLPCRSLSTPGL